MCGGENCVCRAARSNASRIGSTSGEWNACDTARRWQRTPRAAKIGAHRIDGLAAAPEMTVCAGPLTAAMETMPVSAASSRPPLAPVAKIAAIAPPAGSDCISRPRSAMSARGVLGRHHARDARRDVFADRMAEDHVGRHAPGAPQLGERILDREQRGLRERRLVEPACDAARAKTRTRKRPAASADRARSAQRSSAARNTGWVSSSWRAMPAYCAPWPVNRNAMRGGSRRATRAMRAPSAACLRASAIKALAQLADGTREDRRALRMMGARRGGAEADVRQVVVASSAANASA